MSESRAAIASRPQTKKGLCLSPYALDAYAHCGPGMGGVRRLAYAKRVAARKHPVARGYGKHSVPYCEARKQLFPVDQDGCNASQGFATLGSEGPYRSTAKHCPPWTVRSPIGWKAEHYPPL